jgi:NADH-quinone oxidoreductase subunit H
MEYYLIQIVEKLTEAALKVKWTPPHWLNIAIIVGCTMIFISVNVLFLIWLERKVCGRIQSRMGPMTSGPKCFALCSMWLGGWFQTIWDALKLLFKEDLTPGRADKWVFVTAPFIVFGTCLMAYMALPFGPGLIPYDINIGILYIIGISGLTVISILMAGWSSNNKYSLLGGLRSAAQIISYEVPLLIAILGPVMMAGSLQMTKLVEAQSQFPYGWFIFTNPIGFFVYFIAATAEVNRPPFDMPEAEQELVGGFNTEYSGMKFAMFYLSEFANMFLVAGLCTIVFLGGWLLPFGWQLPQTLILGVIPVSVIGGILVFFVKTYAVVLLFMWVRWTYPRVRPDQLMNFGWKTLLPLAFLNFVVAAFVIMGKEGAFQSLFTL